MACKDLEPFVKAMLYKAGTVCKDLGLVLGPS